MKINAINNVMRPVRNVAAAALVAVAPAAAKAESAVTPKQFATTNTINMASWAKTGQYNPLAEWTNDVNIPAVYYNLDTGLGIIPIKTNEMARVCNVSQFTPQNNGSILIGGVADGHVATAKLMGSEKLGTGAEWKLVDFLQDETPYKKDTATKWFYVIDKPVADKFKFYKWMVNPDLDRLSGTDYGTELLKLDVNGNPIK